MIFASTSDGTILKATSTDGYAWGENVGWINFAASSSNVHITSSGLSGYMWDSIYGWVNLKPISGGNTGVINDGAGNLSGYAWSKSAGWVNFSGVTINSSGKFIGQAGTQGSIYGRINFSCDKCNVVTDWRPTQTPITTGGGWGGSWITTPSTSTTTATTTTVIATTTATTTNIIATTTIPTIHTLPKDFCFNKNLSPFTSDPDVENLKIFLNYMGLPVTLNDSENNYYDVETINAVKLFQGYYSDEILRPAGLVLGTGNFGNATRKKINDILGCKTITVEIATTTPEKITIAPELSPTTIPEITINNTNRTPIQEGQNGNILPNIEVGTTTEYNLPKTETTQLETTSTTKVNNVVKPKVSYINEILNLNIIQKVIDSVSQGYKNILSFTKNTITRLIFWLGL